MAKKNLGHGIEEFFCWVTVHTTANSMKHKS